MGKKNKFVLFTAFLILLVTGSPAFGHYRAASREVAFETHNPVNILYIGNSFTKFKSGKVVNSVEMPFKELAERAGFPVNITTISHSNSYLKYYAGTSLAHLSYHRELITALVTKKWDYVVLQEQSKAPLNDIDHNTFPTIMQLKQQIQLYQPNAKILLYMTHGFDDGTTTMTDGTKQHLSKSAMQEKLFAAYGYLENKTGLKVVPVGLQFARAEKLFPGISLLAADRKHPSYAGFYLAASCFYFEVFGSLPAGAPEALTNCNLSEDQLRSLESLVNGTIKLNKTKLDLKVNQKAALAAYSSFPSAVQWQSLNRKIAAVDKNTGVVTGKTSGSTVVMAISGDGYRAYCNVTVKLPMKFRKAYYVAAKGDSIRIQPLTTAEEISWRSHNKSAAKVSSDGVVTAAASGRAKIQATNKYDSTDKAAYYLYISLSQPTGIRVVKDGVINKQAKTGCLKISWKKAAGAKKYKVYRAGSKNGKYQQIGSSNTGSFTDKKVSLNKVYYYKIAAANSYVQCDSEKSKSGRGIVINAPSVKVSVTKKKYVRLSWKRNKSADGYVIYRSVKKNSGYQKIAAFSSSQRTGYTDKQVKKKTRYYYRMRAYKKLDGKTLYSTYSSKHEIRIKNKKQ